MSTTSSPSRAELTALNNLLYENHVPAASRATVLESVTIARGSKIAVLASSSEDEDFVTLHPEGAGPAAYVHVDKLSLRFDRRRALRTVQEYEFCEIEEGLESAAEWLHLAIEDWAVEQHAIVVRRLLLSAIVLASVHAASEAAAAAAAASAAAERLSRRTPSRTTRPTRVNGASAVATRPTRATPTVRVAPPSPPPRPKPAVCAVHFVQLVNGRCDYCDD